MTVAHSLSAKKRIRQNKKRRVLNLVRKTALKKLRRKVSETAGGGDVSTAQQAVRALIKKADQIAAKGAIHRNKAGRIKSRAQKRLNAMKGAAQPS